MLKNYLKIALRNLLKNRSYVIINTLGLGIAIACCIAVYLFLAYNIEFNSFHDKEEVKDVYRVHTQILFNDGNIQHTTATPILLGPSAKDEIAGIEQYTRFAAGGANVSFGNEAFSEYISYADSSLFSMFDFPLVSGSHAAFNDLHSIFLSEELATKYFGDDEAVGKTLTLSFEKGVEKQFVVGGVVAKFPINTSLFLQALIRIEHFAELRLLDGKQPWEDWNMVTTFVKLTNPDQAEATAKHFDKYISLRNDGVPDQEVQGWKLEHFNDPIDVDNISYAYRPYINFRMQKAPLIIFGTLAMLILLIACFNLTNTSIAIAASRLKEIGVRKSIGAHRKQIVLQFLMETGVLMLLSVIVGYMISMVLVPEFMGMWDFPFAMKDLNVLNMIIALFCLMIFASVVAGLYPALFNSRFSTVNLLKGTVKVKGSNLLTRFLVSTQFALSVIVLVAGIGFTQNADYQDSIQFGYDKEQVLSIEIQSEKEFNSLKSKALANPKVLEFSGSIHQLGWSTYESPVKYKGEDYNVKHVGVGNHYFKAMGLEFTEGRAFDTEKASELATGLVVSRELVKFLNIQDNPIGEEIEVHGTKRRILGVVDDFLDNLYQSAEAQPFVFYTSGPEFFQMAIVRTTAEDLAEVNNDLEASWKEMYPTKPYNSHYQEDVLMEGKRYLTKNMTNIFAFLSILGTLLSVSGIFSLASLNVVRRSKEIGIRKALGSSVSGVIVLLNREFVIILIVAGILGALGGYYGTEMLFTEIYALYKSVAWFTLVGSAFLIIVVGLATTSLTTMRAARMNPVKTLRDE